MRKIILVSLLLLSETSPAQFNPFNSSTASDAYQRVVRYMLQNQAASASAKTTATLQERCIAYSWRDYRFPSILDTESFKYSGNSGFTL